MGIFPVDNPNKDYFSELCTADMDANSVNPGASARDSTGWNLKSGLSWEKDYDLPEGDYNVIWHCSGIQKFPNIRANGFTLVLGDKNTNLIMWLGSKTEGRYVTNYKFEKIQADREKEFAVKENQEPVWDDQNTQFNSNIGETDPESLPEIETEKEYEGKEFEDKEKDIKEKSGELEKDYEKELEKEKEVYKLAIDTLITIPEFHYKYKGSTVCYEPIKLLKKQYASICYILDQHKNYIKVK